LITEDELILKVFAISNSKIAFILQYIEKAKYFNKEDICSVPRKLRVNDKNWKVIQRFYIDKIAKFDWKKDPEVILSEKI